MTGHKTRTEPAQIPPNQRRTIRRQLLNWYDRNRRDLPWRRHHTDAYAQWVAEVMLQQTRVETVRDYYTSFLRRFPTIRKLADARHDTVMKHWEGLGYYRRALFLHRAARLLRDERRAIPTTAAELRELPGLGDYTAAAIASIAYGEPRAAVDGNVARIVARLFGVDEDILSKHGRATITKLAQELIPRKRPGDFNQAWMDLGTAVCTPRSPDCATCPLRTGCVAAATNRTGELPVRDGGRKNRTTPQIEMITVLFVSEGRLLVRQRPRGGLWSGLWEFPTVEKKESQPDAKFIGPLSRQAGLSAPRRYEHAGTVRHKLTHRDLRFDVYVAPIRNDTIKGNGEGAKWKTPAQLRRLSMSTAQRRIHTLAKPLLKEH